MQTQEWPIFPSVHGRPDPRSEGQVVVDATQEPEARPTQEEQTTMSMPLPQSDPNRVNEEYLRTERRAVPAVCCVGNYAA